jgi:hypothetical protein
MDLVEQVLRVVVELKALVEVVGEVLTHNQHPEIIQVVPV